MKLLIESEANPYDGKTESFQVELESLTAARHWIINHLDQSKKWTVTDEGPGITPGQLADLFKDKEIRDLLKTVTDCRALFLEYSKTGRMEGFDKIAKDCDDLIRKH